MTLIVILETIIRVYCIMSIVVDFCILSLEIYLVSQSPLKSILYRRSQAKMSSNLSAEWRVSRIATTSVLMATPAATSVVVLFDRVPHELEARHYRHG